LFLYSSPPTIHSLCSIILPLLLSVFFFFFNAPAPTEIYTLSLHDALPIWAELDSPHGRLVAQRGGTERALTDVPYPNHPAAPRVDRKSTRLNSSHVEISYAVFCLKKKKKTKKTQKRQQHK